MTTRIGSPTSALRRSRSKSRISLGVWGPHRSLVASGAVLSMYCACGGCIVGVDEPTGGSICGFLVFMRLPGRFG